MVYLLPQPYLSQNVLTRTVVSTSTVNATTTQVVATSSIFTPTSNGMWCFLVQRISSNANSQSEDATEVTNEYVTISSSAAVRLSSMNTDRSNISVSLKWRTGSEVDTAGFNIYLSENVHGPYTHINPQLIAATNKIAGNSYEYGDITALPYRMYYYQLEDVEMNGSTRHDPILAKAAPADANNGNGVIVLTLGIAAIGTIVGTLIAQRIKRVFNTGMAGD